MKIHLGCNLKKIYGFVNVDTRAEVLPDVLDDAKLATFGNETAELIYASHIAEHIPRNSFYSVLQEWKRVLKPNGILRLSVPDLQAICEHYIFHKDLRVLENLLYGSQKHDYDFHYNGWDETTLREDLRQAGFIQIHRWDWRHVEHSYIDDYSKAYLPKFAFDTGRLMSLNLQGTK